MDNNAKDIRGTVQKSLTLGKLAEIIGAHLPSEIEPNTPCGRVMTQSMYVEPGDVIISAGWYPHSQIIPESLERGATVVFCSHEVKKDYPDFRVIPIDDPIDSVTRFERWCAEGCSAKRIAITGSVGKTTTVGLIKAVIANTYPTLTHHTMSNSHGAILRNVQRLEPSHEFWVQEVGGVKPGYIESSARFLAPDAVVLTNIGESHLNLYQTKENILKDKGSLEKYAQPDGVVIISLDDDMLRTAKYSHRVITCSYSNPQADYYAENVHMDMDGLYFDILCKDGRFPIHLNLYGNYNVYNALFAFAVGRWANVPAENIAPLFEEYRSDGMRQNMIHIGGYNLLVDSFNAEPKTVLGSAETLSQIPANGGRKIFVTGHIDKLGDNSAAMHEQLGRSLAKLDLDLILLFAGDSIYTYKGLLEEGCTHAILMESREQLDDWLRQNVTHEDILFFKSGQFEAALAKTVDHVFGTNFQNGQQFNEGTLVESDGFRIRLRADNIAEIEGYDGPDKDIVIPAVCGEHTVCRIAPKAFSRKDITSVVIPDSVDNIGYEAFYSCSSINSLRLPASLKIVGKNAFNNCRRIRELEIPSGTIHLDRHAFYDCVGLTDVTVPASVGFMGTDVFGTTSPRSTQDLRFHYEPGSYAEQMIMRQNMTHTGGYNLFVDCLSSGTAAVLSAASALSQIPAGNNGRRIFATDLIDEELTSSLAGLGLDSILLFAGDGNPTLQGTGSNIHMIGTEQQLYDWLCRNVSRNDLLVVKGGSEHSSFIRTVDHAFGTDFKNGQQFSEGTLVESDGFRIRLRADNIAEIEGYDGPDKDIVIPAVCGEHTVCRIAPKAFSRKDITSVVIPDSVDNIGYEAFYSCSSINSLLLPASLKIVGKNAFNNCRRIRELEIPSGTIHLDRHAFYDCVGLTDVTVPASVGFMGTDVFGTTSPRSTQDLRFHYEPGSYAEQMIMRQNMTHTGGYNLFVDCLSSGTAAVLSAASALSQIPAGNNGRRIFATDLIDEELTSSLAGLGLDSILLFAGDGNPTLQGTGSNIHVIGTEQQLYDWLCRNVSRNDLLVVKGGSEHSSFIRTVDHAFGTDFKNGQQFSEGTLVESDGFRIRLRADNIAEIEGYDGPDKDIVIPAVCGEHTVCRIAPKAFSRKDITSVVIPDSVDNIGYEAFYSCSSINSLRLPASLKIVGKNAFNNCRRIRELEIPSGTIHLDRHAFYDCVGLTDVTVPASVGFMGTDVFGTTSPRSTQDLRFHYEPGSYAEQMIMRQNMTHTGGYNLFVDCLSSGTAAVLSAASALSQIPAGNNGRRIFATDLIDEELTSSLAGLGLDSILLFAGDGNPTLQGTGSNIHMIGTEQQLYDWLCRNVSRNDLLVVKGGSEHSSFIRTVDHAFGTDFKNGQQFSEGTLVESDGFRIRLRADNIAEIEGYDGPDKDIVIPAVCGEHTVCRIAPKAFSRKDITSVVIPDSVDNIGYEAFYSCSSINSLRLPASLKIVGKNAFNNCRRIRELEIPSGTIHLDRHAFYDCVGLTDVTVPASVGFMGTDVFGTTSPRSTQDLRFHYEPGSYAEQMIMRQNMTHTGGYNLFVDCLSSGTAAVLSAASALSQIPAGNNGRRIFATDLIDEELTSSLAGLGLDSILLFAGDGNPTLQGTGSNIHVIGTEQQLYDWLCRNVSRNDLLVVKGGSEHSSFIRTVDHAFGTDFKNGQQFSEGTLVESDGFRIRLRADNIAEIEGYDGPDKDIVIPAVCGEHTVCRIAPKAFSRKDITSVVIPDSVDNIGYEAFYSCSSINSLRLPASLKIVGKNAFNNCRRIRELEIPSGTIHLDRHAFYDCVGLTDVTVPASVGFMGTDVFGTTSPRSTQDLRFHYEPGSYAEQMIINIGK